MGAIIERINEQHLRPISDFNCGIYESLNLYLQCEAYDYDKSGEGNTYLVINERDNRIIAYFTLKSNALQLKMSESNEFTVIPAVEIARFAVDVDYQDKKLGTAIMGSIVMKIIKNVKELIGIKCIMVFALDYEKCLHFYEKFGFKKFSKDIQSLIESYNDGCKGMYVSLEDFN